MTRFSRNTIIEIMDALEFSSHVQIQEFLVRFEIEEADNQRTLDPRRLGIAEYLIKHPNKKGPWGADIIIEIIEYLIQSRCKYREPEEELPRLVRALKRDGYIIQDGFLKSVLPEEIHLAEQENEFTTLLEQFGFEITKGHYKQAVNAHIRGDWAGANGQLRTCIESLFDTIAENFNEDPEKLPATSDNKLTLLAQVNPPFLLQHLNEWEPSGKGFIQGFRKLLHPEGAHPGLSTEGDSTLRLHLVIIIANYYLRRLRMRLNGY